MSVVWIYQMDLLVKSKCSESHFLRKKTKKMDRYYARVTLLGNFRELKKILAAPLVIIFFF